MTCTCTTYETCAACWAAYEVASAAAEVAAWEKEAALRQKEYEQSCSPCPRCGTQCLYGICDKRECRAAEFDQHYRPLIREQAWDVSDYPGDELPECEQHAWGEVVLEDDIEGGVYAERTCGKCGVVERQTLQRGIEPPNCYVPGYGWRVI